MSRIMLVDDEPMVLKSLERLLKRGSHEVEVFTHAKQALKRVHTATFDIVISDYRMPEMDGIAFLKEVKTMQPDAIRMVLSGYGDLDALKSAINEAEIYRFISKPWDDYDLVTDVEKAAEFRSMLVDNRRLAEQVRRQREQLSKQEHALKELEELHPEIASVVWGEDGSVIIDGEEMG